MTPVLQRAVVFRISRAVDGRYVVIYRNIRTALRVPERVNVPTAGLQAFLR
jgi:hypothetical protein